MTAVALDLFAQESAREAKSALSPTELASAEWFCTNLVCPCPKERKAAFSDIERAAVNTDTLERRPCASCGQIMTWSYRPDCTAPNCAFCDQPVTTYKGQGDPLARCVAILDDGTFAWAHVACRMRVKKDKRVAMARPTRAEHPDCARCGKPWAEHFTFGFESRSCTDGPTDTALYERAPGVVGVEAIE